MGEIIKEVANLAGWCLVLAGIFADLGSFFSILVAAAGFGFAVFRALKEREEWLEKRDARRERNKKKG